MEFTLPECDRTADIRVSSEAQGAGEPTLIRNLDRRYAMVGL